MENELYMRIAESLDEGLQGVPKNEGRISPAFLSFLRLIYEPAEAEVAQHLGTFPRFKTTDQEVKASGLDPAIVRDLLNRMHAKYALMGKEDAHCLPTIFYVFNFHHRYPEVKPGDLEAAKLYQQFFVEEGFYRDFETSRKGMPFFRTIFVGRTIAPDQKVLSSEAAMDRIDGLGADVIPLVPCPCRTRTEKLGTRECKDRFPIGCCIIPGDNGEKFIKLGMGKQVSKEQAKAYLGDMVKLGLVPNSDNYKSPDPFVICLCCGCCCSMTRGRSRWDHPETILPSNFIPIAGDECKACGKCVKRCFFGALAMDEARGRSVVDPEKCIGCGVCVAGCPTGALKLHRFERAGAFETVMDFALRIHQDNSSAESQ